MNQSRLLKSSQAVATYTVLSVSILYRISDRGNLSTEGCNVRTKSKFTFPCTDFLSFVYTSDPSLV